VEMAAVPQHNTCYTQERFLIIIIIIIIIIIGKVHPKTGHEGPEGE
jgi:hypothetical protein